MLKLRRAGAGARHLRGGSSLTSAPPRNRPVLRSRTLWYAIHHPGLTVQQTLPAGLRISDYVCAADAETLLIEIGGSLRYFGGWRRLHETLEQHLDELYQHQPEVYRGSVTPSPAASTLLARCARQKVVAHSSELRSALAGITIAELPLAARLKASLQRCGLLYLRDIWRLPAAQLRLRFGRELSEYLDRLLALRPERPPRWQPPPQFSRELYPEYPLHNTAAIVHHAVPLFAEYREFLLRRHLLSAQFDLMLHLSDGQQLALPVITRYASRDTSLFLALFELALEKHKLTADVIGLTLSSISLQPYSPDQQANGLTDMLSARLGADNVLRLQLAEEHAPEFSSTTQHWHSPPSLLADTCALPYRAPAWLLRPAQRLRQLHNRPIYKSQLTLLSGPQRIETRWWAGSSIRRDYYVARNRQGSQLWIYQELGSTGDWYLHGFFC